jgi:hypothetical protein
LQSFLLIENIPFHKEIHQIILTPFSYRYFISKPFLSVTMSPFFNYCGNYHIGIQKIF